jgi:hypothetical protein
MDEELLENESIHAACSRKKIRPKDVQVPKVNRIRVMISCP